MVDAALGFGNEENNHYSSLPSGYYGHVWSTTKGTKLRIDVGWRARDDDGFPVVYPTGRQDRSSLEKSGDLTVNNQFCRVHRGSRTSCTAAITGTQPSSSTARSGVPLYHRPYQ